MSADQGPAPSPWPSDHLTDAERRLARLWRTMADVDEGEWVEMTDERDALLYSIDDALARATTAATTGPVAPAPAAVLDGLADFVARVGYLRADLVQGVAIEDMTGSFGNVAGRLEDAAEALAGHLEVAEQAAGRPPLSEDQAVADIAERLHWGRP